MNKKLLHVVTNILLTYYAFIGFMVISGSSIINRSELLGEKLNMLLNLTFIIAIVYAIYTVKYIIETSLFEYKVIPILIMLTVVAILIGFIVFHDVLKSDKTGMPYYSDDYINMIDKAQVFATGKGDNILGSKDFVIRRNFNIADKIICNGENITDGDKVVFNSKGIIQYKINE